MKKLPVKKGQAYLFEDRLNRNYLTGVDIAEGFLLYSENPVYFTDLRYFSAAKEKLSAAGVRALPFKSMKDLEAEIKKNSVKMLFVDYTATTLSRAADFKKLCKRIKDCSETLIKMRAVKDGAEIAFIEKACKIAEQAVAFAFSKARAGMTETELKDILENRMKELGAEGPSFDTIVAFGKNAAVPHHETGADELQPDQPILIDTGCLCGGYCSDITRTAFFGTPDKEFTDAYGAVLSANLIAEEKIYADISGRAADKFARDLLTERGYGEYFTHSLGHGVGLEIHEFPHLSPAKDEILAENSVFTVEPGVYMDGKFGIRIEDTCVMRGGKAVRLFSDDKSLIVIDPKKAAEK